MVDRTGLRAAGVLPVLLPVAVGLVLMIAAYTTVVVVQSMRQCTVVLRVQVSTEKYAVIKELGGRYGRAKRTLSSGSCARVDVIRTSSGIAKDQLVDGPVETAPHVWLPSTSMWVDQLRAEAPDKAPREPASRSIARSPVVIAMPQDRAEALGWPGKRFTWADVLGISGSKRSWREFDHPEWGQFYVGRENPTTSTSGLASTIAAYYAATVGTGRPGSLDAKSLDDPKVQSYVRRIERNVARGVMQDDILDVLAEMLKIDERRAYTDTPISALVVQEELIQLYNTKNLGGDPGRLEDSNAPSPRVKLVPIHPSDGTLMLDHPYAILPAADLLDDGRLAAEDFRRYLLSDRAARRMFRDMGFRDADGAAGDLLATTAMIPPYARKVADKADSGLLIRETPDATTVRLVLDNWASLKRRANILVAADVSGSMKYPIGGGDSTVRADAAKAAATRSINLLDREDRVGMWFFSKPGKAYESPLQPSELGDGSAFRGVLKRLKPDDRNNTGLYVTVREAHRKMVREYAPQQVNAVIVLTDGKNYFPENSYRLGALEKYLRENGRAKPVALYFIAFGAQALGTRPALEAIVKANGAGAVLDALDGDAVERVLGDIFSGETIGPAGRPAR